MDGSGSPNCDRDDAGIAPDTSVADDPKASSPKRSRRFVQKRVVTFPVADADGSRPKGGGDGAPPSDSWAWRKYGQKPIKGSPYPRGYYKCSSSKGCPAKKQVERSHVDPTVLVVTYACDHDHPWPLPKNHHHQSSSPSAADSKQSPSQAAPIHISPPDPDDKFSDLIGEDPAVMMHDDYCWFSDVGSPSTTSPAAATDELLLGPIAGSADVSMPFPVEDSWEEEEDSLFAGLGELPEFSVVFRRGFFERRRCDLAAMQ